MEENESTEDLQVPMEVASPPKQVKSCKLPNQLQPPNLLLLAHQSLRQQPPALSRLQSLLPSQGAQASNGRNIKFYQDQPLIDEAVFFLNGFIDTDTVAPIVQGLTSIALQPRHEWPEHITMFINSPGGSVSDGMHLIDVMRQSPIPVVTVGQGIVASMGFSILMAGIKKGRFASETALLMSHQYYGGNEGKEHEMVANIKANSIVSDILMKHYTKCTGKTEKYVRKNLLPAHDVFMTAEEAVKHGAIDEVIKIYN
jgi:ATP-dependent Clp protease protease subunit